MNIYLTQPEFNESIVRDNIWQWTPIELANHRYPPKFQIHKDDQYVVSFMFRSKLLSNPCLNCLTVLLNDSLLNTISKSLYIEIV